MGFYEYHLQDYSGISSTNFGRYKSGEIATTFKVKRDLMTALWRMLTSKA